MNTQQYRLFKLPLKELIKHSFCIDMTVEEGIANSFLVEQADSLIFDQIQRLRGYSSQLMTEIILVEAKKNPRTEAELKHILAEGFHFNGNKYIRFGKSASQAKAGITAFVLADIFDELYQITQMDIPVTECVISKYEAQRCLSFSSCTIVKNYFPRIVIIGEYEKTIREQFIRHVVPEEREFTDEQTGETKKYNARIIKEGMHDIQLSPFDGCGCHEAEFMVNTSAALGLSYHAIGNQIRLPFMKGYSVYVPFRKILKEWGYDTITDIYGVEHHVDEIDCIWNTTMFKGHSLFTQAYGNQAWKNYLETIRKYDFKLGISKYSHHVNNLPRKTRMNFQYLQCLDLWNPNYISWFEQPARDNYDILAAGNRGKIIDIARYTTDLFERIVKGDKFYTYKFLGINDTANYHADNKFVEAVLINDAMLKDPAVKQFIYRKLNKFINDAKVGKIYADGFYHTIVGDMIGYLEFAVGLNPVGCLQPQQFFCQTMDEGEALSFRSPLVCPSEVNKISIVTNEITNQWFSYFKDQDVVMFNMYDISAPQQGGADFDGDIVLLCNEKTIVNSKIDKPIIIDIDDKATAMSKAYTKENLIEYEMMTRDSRIGEITNAATSIENKYTANPDIQKLYSDYASLLRIFQGKEIDFLKTGLRWQMNSGLRGHLKKLPYFLLYNYPKKLEAYHKIMNYNKKCTDNEKKMESNVFRSPSPMNELCEYICAWEKKQILWDKSYQDTRPLILNHALTFSDPKILRTVKHLARMYFMDFKQLLSENDTANHPESFQLYLAHLNRAYREQLYEATGISDEELLANYVINASYSSTSISKFMAWNMFGDYLIQNLKANSGTAPKVKIEEATQNTDNTYEYLGKYYYFESESLYTEPERGIYA